MIRRISPEVVTRLLLRAERSESTLGALAFDKVPIKREQRVSRAMASSRGQACSPVGRLPGQERTVGRRNAVDTAWTMTARVIALYSWMA